MASSAGSDPAAIQREIEATRQELAETLDAIAEKVSPKRVASRGGARVKEKINAVFTQTADGSAGGQVPDIGTATRPAGSEARPEISPEEALAAGVPPGYPYRSGGVTAYAGQSESVLRKDRVAMAAGAGVLLLVLMSRRRKRKRSAGDSR
ncbi:MAG: DUF3618 domain-containing protein [Actinomycetota bacterium]|nr:DUF3618 domain-containing protein [Actinomycetota bacterium]